ncbi:MAG: ABC transporter ATP-binding protein [Desulfovibrio sp.]|jgi:phospholipid/cholesterol/gamma-HCH transport system ATP-binding protein|nr:ABC transporter ATP-binding protein [Desulfovibrio sp.]
MNDTDKQARSGQAPIIRLRGITNRFGSQVVHDKLDLDIRPGEILGLIGGSGTGKSVLLRTILGLNRQAAGSVEIMGLDMDSASEEEKADIRRQWGVLFQDGALFSSLRVGDNIAFPLREFTRISRPMQEAVARMKIAFVGLPGFAYDKFPGELSGGMRKRAGLARALVMDPAILLLDEPTAGLDPLGAAGFDQLIKDLRDSLNLTVCMATHDVDTLFAVCDRVAVLAEKRIYAVDTIPNLLRVDYPWIQEYFSGPRGRAAASGYKREGESGNEGTNII